MLATGQGGGIQAGGPMLWNDPMESPLVIPVYDSVGHQPVVPDSSELFTTTQDPQLDEYEDEFRGESVEETVCG